MEEILHQAERLEKEYDWLGAADSYEKVLKLLPEDDFSRKAETQERLGYAFYRAAFQAESSDEFRQRLNQAINSYEKANELRQKLSELTKTARILRCSAIIALIGYWLTSDVPEKKRMLSECWKLTKDALKAYAEMGDGPEYGKTYNQLSNSVVFGFCLEWDFQTRRKMLGEAVEYGERAIKFLSAIEKPGELAKAYAKTAFYLGVIDYYFPDTKEPERESRKCQDYWLRAKELSEDLALVEVLYPIFGPQEVLWGEATDEAFTNLKKALDFGRKTKDKFIIGCALDWMTYHRAWTSAFMEVPDEGRELVKTVLQLAEDAEQQYAPISFVSPRADFAWVGMISGEYATWLGSLETDLRKKHDLYEKAIEPLRDGLKRAENSRYPETMAHANHIFSALLVSLARTETKSEEKKKLLEEALERRNENIRITEQAERLLLWNRGISQNAIAGIKYELANLVESPEAKRNRLQEAMRDREDSLKLLVKGGPQFGRKSTIYFSPIGSTEFSLGLWLNSLYELTNDAEHLRKAAEAFTDAAGSYQKTNVKSRIAECLWKAAIIYGELGNHLKAAENFQLASSNYTNAAEKIRQLKDFYQDHALYMQAWSEIEKARYHHSRQEYGSATEHYEKAATMHQSLKQWSYLAPNYSAWAKVEYAEDVSRREQSEEAIQAFEEAARLFIETEKSLQAQFDKIEDQDEKKMATNLVQSTGLRLEYCVGRIALEQARILDKKGDHYSSSEKYGTAAETFEKINQSLESEQEQKEFNLIITLSRAWQKMTLAETETSPALYAEASQLFEKAKEFSPNEKTKMLVLGNSRFCRALEAGTRFVDTRDADAYAEAMKCLETASDYYIKAGFPKVSEYSDATKLLFDAYLHIDGATKESDPEKKAKLYAMAEKVLQTSAGSFMKAEHPEKREQVLGLLEKIKKERELATSLTEVLHAPSIVSTTSSFATPTPTREEAIGSERFEHADVQANLIVRQKDLKVGENMDLEIQLVNAGKAPALLVKVTEMVPEGFEIAEKPEVYRIEDSYIDMKGRRLDPLKTEEVRLVLKPKVQGAFDLKPTILYLDENGKYKSHEPEPVTITVKELGIKGWIKGER
jgi:tetratricopeptide (TPR) repeat protein